jgi:hypothetical protein
MVIGFREGNLHRLRDRPMGVMANSSIETNEEEQVDPPVVREVDPTVVRQVVPPVVRHESPLVDRFIGIRYLHSWYSFIGSQSLEGVNPQDLVGRSSLPGLFQDNWTSGGFKRIKGRITHPEGVYL